MKILFVADPLESFKIYKDTTFAMMREAHKRGHHVSACEMSGVRWQRGEAVSAQVRDITLTGQPDAWFTETATRRVAVSVNQASLWPVSAMSRTWAETASPRCQRTPVISQAATWWPRRWASRIMAKVVSL